METTATTSFNKPTDYKKRVATLLILLTSVGQLAFSQIHIATITKVFSTTIGLYLFAFILVGLLSLFNIGKLSEGKRKYIAVLTNFVTMICGGIYIYMLVADVNSSDKVLFESVSASIALTSASIVLLLVANILILIDKEL